MGAGRVVRGVGRLAAGGVRVAVDVVAVGGPPVLVMAGVLVGAGLLGVPWWVPVLIVVGLAGWLAADDGSGLSVSRLRGEVRHQLELLRSRYRARVLARSWPRVCERAGWVSDVDLARRRPVPVLRFVRVLGRRLVVAWRPLESVPPGDYGTHVDQLRRCLGAHVADWRPVSADPGTVVGLFALDPLPEHVPDRTGVAGRETETATGWEGSPGKSGVGPVGGPAPPPVMVGRLAVHQEERFVLGAGAGGVQVTWCPAEAPHLLVCGVTGGGKGSVTRTLVAQALGAGWEVCVIDGKDGGEYRWAGDAGAEVCRQGVVVAADRLGDLEQRMLTDAATLYAHGAEHWRDVDPDWPRVLVVVDEAADLLVQRRGAGEREEDQHRAGFAARLNRLVAQGRAVGIHVVVAVQRPDAQILSGFLRANLTGRVAVGHLDPDGAEMVFPGHRDLVVGALDGTPGRAVAVGLHRGHTTPTPLQVHYLRAVESGRQVNRAG